MQAYLTRGFGAIAAAFALVLAIPALPALAAWPPEVAAANSALANAASFRVTTTEGTTVEKFVVNGSDRERFTLPANAVAAREPDASDGVAPAHLYHIIYPGGTPQIRWYIRVSDGRVHRILRGVRGAVISTVIDNYR
jgi:hypothetical protein